MAKVKKKSPADAINEVMLILEPLVASGVFGKYTRYIQSAMALLTLVLALTSRDTKMATPEGPVMSSRYRVPKGPSLGDYLDKLTPPEEA